MHTRVYIAALEVLEVYRLPFIFVCKMNHKEDDESGSWLCAHVHLISHRNKKEKESRNRRLNVNVNRQWFASSLTV